MNKTAVRKASQRLTDLQDKCCEKCGSTKMLQRHHVQYTPENFVILCQWCHRDVHMADGTWGIGLKKMKDCYICGKPFTPSHSKKHKTCSASCLSELGRRNAEKRWGATTRGKKASTASASPTQGELSV